MTDNEYILREFRKAGSEGIAVKVRGEEGESRWVSLTPEQWDQVKSVFIED